MSIKEQIAKIICRSKNRAHTCGCQCSFGTAEAILALLEPVMLTKDEAEYLNVRLGACHLHYACQDCKYDKPCDTVFAKLKLIQEEE